jgi:hypothetical protein
MCLAILEKAKVGIAIGVTFESTAVPHIVVPLTFVLPTVSIPHHSLAVPLAV